MLPSHMEATSWSLVMTMLVTVSLIMSVRLNGVVAQQQFANISLFRFPFIMTHDSGTGYLTSDNVVNKWAKTQSDGFTSQLECGARAFDVRPKLVAGTLYMAHGVVTVNVPISSVLEETMEWCHNHVDELVILYVSHGDGQGVDEAMSALLASKNITFIDDTLNEEYTVGQAMQQSDTIRGGSLLAISDRAMSENYDPSTECYYEVKEGDMDDDDDDEADEWDEEKLSSNSSSVLYTWCYDNATQLYPFNHMWDSLKQVSSKPISPSAGQMQMLQAHWQYSASSVAAGVLHDSSILLDTQRSHINSKVADQLSEKGLLLNVNVVELDDVCHDGDLVFKALRHRIHLQWLHQQYQSS